LIGEKVVNERGKTVKLMKADHLKYMKIAVEVTRNYTQAGGHGPMMENIYRGLCKIHEGIPEDDEATANPPAAGTPGA
jgi:hypothetical protein